MKKMKNNKPVKLRKFKPQDAEAVSKIMIRAFLSFLKEKMDELTLKSFSPKTLKKNSNVKGDNSETISFVVEEEKEIVGYIRGSANMRGLGTLGVVGVSPDCFHKGVGMALMKRLEKFWRKKKVKKVSTSVSSHNTRALMYYLKNGFIPVGYQKDRCIVGVDEVILDRFLK